MIAREGLRLKDLDDELTPTQEKTLKAAQERVIKKPSIEILEHFVFNVSQVIYSLYRYTLFHN